MYELTLNSALSLRFFFFKYKKMEILTQKIFRKRKLLFFLIQINMNEWIFFIYNVCLK